MSQSSIPTWVLFVAVVTLALLILAAWLWTSKQDRVNRCYELEGVTQLACLRREGVSDGEIRRHYGIED